MRVAQAFFDLWEAVLNWLCIGYPESHAHFWSSHLGLEHHGRNLQSCDTDQLLPSGIAAVWQACD
jgi:hypothetical protein